MTELQPLTTRESFTHNDYSSLPAATKGLHKYWYTKSITPAYLLYWASMAPALPGELRTDMPASRSSLATCSASTRTSRDFDPVTDIATWYGESSGWSCNICNKNTLISNYWGHFAMTFFKKFFSTIRPFGWYNCKGWLGVKSQWLLLADITVEVDWVFKSVTIFFFL